MSLHIMSKDALESHGIQSRGYYCAVNFFAIRVTYFWIVDACRRTTHVATCRSVESDRS